MGENTQITTYKFNELIVEKEKVSSSPGSESRNVIGRSDLLREFQIGAEFVTDL